MLFLTWDVTRLDVLYLIDDDDDDFVRCSISL